MQLNSTDLSLLAQCAIEAAKAAGSLIRSYANKDIIVHKKAGGDSLASQVVTEVDLKCEELILQHLNATLQQYDLALLSEESIDDKSRLEKDYFWCIDPMDGTLSFTESKAGYAVSIALISKNGEPQIGVVYDPLNQVLYHAIREQGAFRNEKPWESISESKSSLSFFYNRSFNEHQHFNELVSQLEKMAVEEGYSGLDMPDRGGAAMNACWLIENMPGCYFAFPKKQEGGGSLWDYGATACIFKEMGLQVCDIHGDTLELNRRESTFLNHRGILYASHQEIAERIQNIYQGLIKMRQSK